MPTTTDFNSIAIIIQAVATALLVYYAVRQTQINKRMQELSDYVALFIVPQGRTLQMRNVGRVNLYMHKWEIGSLTTTYVRPVLLPADNTCQFGITLPENFTGQHLIKIYLTDESNEKYISSGEVAVEPVAIQAIPTGPIQEGLSLTATPDQQNQVPGPVAINTNISIQFRVRAWCYKTEKSNWTL
jgi:hypothetical protein